MTLAASLIALGALTLLCLLVYLDYRRICKRCDIDHPAGKERVGLDVDFNWPARRPRPETFTREDLGRDTRIRGEEPERG